MFRIFGRFASRKTASPVDAAVRLFDQGQAGDALAALARILDDPASPPEIRALALDKRGVVRVALGDRDAARLDFEAAIVARPQLAIAHANLGNLALEDGRLEDAIERYRAAIAIDRECALAYHNLAIALKRSGRLAEGVRAMREARRLQSRAAWTRPS